MHIVRRHGIHAALAAGGFALGFLAAAFLWRNPDPVPYAIREYDGRYEFIRPLLICQTREDEETHELRSLEKHVNNVIAKAQKENKLLEASVYFRDLNTGDWMGVNELEPYTPASLLKVPIMIAYFKDAESNPDALSTMYAYDRRGYEDDPLVKKPLLVAGKRYTVLDLVRGMIIQSDNPAMDILQSNVNPSALEETYSALEIHSPYRFGDERYQISAKKYSLFFRVLYNGTFLNREQSNHALSILSESEFDLGIRAGTPSGVMVAHKHGVYGVTRGDSHITEVSDCGIVYNPSSPYLLCIMTRGTNAYELSGVLRSIAETVYQETNTKRK